MAVSNFLMLVLAILALVAAYLVLRVAVGMGKKIAIAKEIHGDDVMSGGNKSAQSGASRNFTPSQT